MPAIAITIIVLALAFGAARYAFARGQVNSSRSARRQYQSIIDKSNHEASHADSS